MRLIAPILTLSGLLLSNNTVRAVTCDSYRTEQECNGRVTDQGYCLWSASDSSCAPDPLRPLRPGMVAVTSFPEDPASNQISDIVIPPEGTPGFSSSPLPPPPPPPLNEDGTAEWCDLPFETGPCRAALTRYYFDRSSGECRSFIYGGCDHNQNYFQSLSDCERESNRWCRARRSAPVPPSNTPNNGSSGTP